ncbi:hypothetical protein IHE45_02G005900 [Dioscorea alata]|uniref:Uncharacterized protein n=1 Tax=Dioscorea alata TaxID=55571 RepID=A0ACB7WN76_DIOAL|nr:hypothetical protein IHE45_02G005900 [Dioscorea alata]
MAAAQAAIGPLSSPSLVSPLRVEVSKNQRNRTFQHCSLGSRSNNHRLHTIKLIRATAVEHFGEPTKFTDHRNNLAQHVWNATVKRVKDFPWNEAKDLALIRFLHLAKNAAKWSFIAIFIFGSASDVYLSIARNKELMIPIGLFIGVILADIIKESSVEFFQQNLKDNETTWQLIGVGFIFILVRLISLSLNLQGRMLLSNICNGGLMQVLWLMKKKQQTKDDKDHGEQTLDAPITSNF